ncbi:hypothetical protein BDC45DRAFT_443688, partial [Circinella umbellata]
SSETAFDRKSIQYAGKQIKQTLKGRDVVFYQAPEGVKRMFLFMYISAGVQLMFCDAEDAPIVLAPKSQRMAIAGGMVSIGIGIAAVMCLYPWR